MYTDARSVRLHCTDGSKEHTLLDGYSSIRPRMKGVPGQVLGAGCAGCALMACWGNHKAMTVHSGPKMGRIPQKAETHAAFTSMILPFNLNFIKDFFI